MKSRPADPCVCVASFEGAAERESHACGSAAGLRRLCGVRGEGEDARVDLKLKRRKEVAIMLSRSVIDATSWRTAIKNQVRLSWQQFTIEWPIYQQLLQ